MKKLKIFMSLLVVILFSFNAFLQAMPSGCSDIEVSWESGAIECPTCEFDPSKYNYNVNFSFEINEQMKKALDDDLDAAKWLIAYFSGENGGQENYAEAKKWFGRALAIGAKASDLRLKGGYDEAYMSTANFSCGKLDISLSSSCNSVNADWLPECYSQKLLLGNSDADYHISFIFNDKFKENNILISSVSCSVEGEDSYIIVKSENVGKKGNYERFDFYKNTSYLGSTLKNPLVQFFIQVTGYEVKLKYKKIDNVLKNTILSLFAKNCVKYSTIPYPVKAVAK